MTGHGEKISRKAHTFMLALLTANNLEDAASVVGISVATARRWYRNEDFKCQFQELQAEITGHSMILLKSSLNDALAVLREVMKNTENSSSARVSAARAVLDNAFRAVEISDILVRLEMLENQMKEPRE